LVSLFAPTPRNLKEILDEDEQDRQEFFAKKFDLEKARAEKTKNEQEQSKDQK